MVLSNGLKAKEVYRLSIWTLDVVSDDVEYMCESRPLLASTSRPVKRNLLWQIFVAKVFFEGHILVCDRGLLAIKVRHAIFGNVRSGTGALVACVTASCAN